MIAFPLRLEFKLGLFLILKVFDAQDRLIALVNDDLQVYSGESCQELTHSLKLPGSLAGALNWKTQRMILRPGGELVGALQAQGARTLWAARYELLDGAGQRRFSIRDRRPWLSWLGKALSPIPLVGGLLRGSFDYLVNPTYLVSDESGQPAYLVRKNRSFFARQFTIEELRPTDSTGELLVLGLIQLVLCERRRG